MALVFGAVFAVAGITALWGWEWAVLALGIGLLVLALAAELKGPRVRQ